jgi:glutathione peroxidase
MKRLKKLLTHIAQRFWMPALWPVLLAMLPLGLVPHMALAQNVAEPPTQHRLQQRSAAPGSAATVPTPAACPALLQKTFKRLQDDAPQNLCQYAGKVVLVVNTASYCGFTNQYEGLEALHAKFNAKGLVVLGFPTNDFGSQEPGNSKQIADFCFNTYGVKFPMFAKSTLKGTDANPLFAALGKATGKSPAWNFHKYLIDRSGLRATSYASEVEPGSAVLNTDISKALAEK